MPIKKIVVKENTITEKEITECLHFALSAFKEKLGQKKFEKRIKKAVKLLVEGIKKTPIEKSVKDAKKVIVKKKKIGNASKVTAATKVIKTQTKK